jgi:predicted nucleotidyltransferase
MPLEAPSLDSPVLAEIVRRLVDVYHPERIYLFGSAARGEGTVDSDYDLMVIVPDDTPPELRRGVRAYEAFQGIRASTDVMVWTRTAFDERLQLRASLPSTVVREGRLLYAT